ncbi:hypothetical protein AVEN_24162-1 [Araneus ventricosus]|uniref:Uncharacterized protein n=1 Tax=Araneus ventricosus TaxID=182803 RepID=A0A4Y2MCE8_ARAVE|nr:hypothetical protein AVEN_24162-1 [Araneus ventricosus]
MSHFECYFVTDLIALNRGEMMKMTTEPVFPLQSNWRMMTFDEFNVDHVPRQCRSLVKSKPGTLRSGNQDFHGSSFITKQNISLRKPSENTRYVKFHTK